MKLDTASLAAIDQDVANLLREVETAVSMTNASLQALNDKVDNLPAAGGGFNAEVIAWQDRFFSQLNGYQTDAERVAYLTKLMSVT